MKKFAFFLVLLFWVYVVGCYSPEKLNIQTLKHEVNRTIYIDGFIYLNYIPYPNKKWSYLLGLKPTITLKIQDYIKKLGWTVTNHHLVKRQIVYFSGSPNLRRGSLDYKRWLDAQKWNAEKHLNPEEVKAFLRSKYMLIYFYYPDPKNIKDYVLEIYFAELINEEKRKNILKQKDYIITLNDFWKMFKSLKTIKTPLIFTLQKAEDFISAAVIFSLKREGIL